MQLHGLKRMTGFCFPVICVYACFSFLCYIQVYFSNISFYTFVVSFVVSSFNCLCCNQIFFLMFRILFVQDFVWSWFCSWFCLFIVLFIYAFCFVCLSVFLSVCLSVCASAVLSGAVLHLCTHWWKKMIDKKGELMMMCDPRLDAFKRVKSAFLYTNMAPLRNSRPLRI
jgi:hypothetical protein